jgi:hypothetical protein
VANTPTDIAQQAIDACGLEVELGDIEDGTREARVLLRAYWQCLRQLHRAVHWDFARKQAPMVLLADASGNTPDVGTMVPTPWLYEYEYPIDCMKARCVPWNWYNQSSPIPPGNIQISDVPQTTGTGQPFQWGQRIIPSRFVVATDYNYPPPDGQITWEVQGVSPQGRTVILSNVKYAQIIYTSLMLYPSVWDSLFRAAMVAYLASEVVLPLSKDKKFGLTIRAQQIAIVKEKITAARIADGNEGTYSSDIPVDWMRTRYVGGGWGKGVAGGVPGGGCDYGSWAGYDSMALADGSVF